MTGWRRFIGLVAVAGFAGLMAIPTGAGQGSQVRQDVDNGQYLVGALTWNDGKGGISWSGASSQDPGGPGSDVSKDVYMSEPMPRTIYINASRLIQLDVYRSGPYNCQYYPATLGAKLNAGETLVGGVAPASTRMATGSGPGKANFGPDPPGFGVCRIRIQTEVGTLREGSVLTLSLTYGASNSKFPMHGMAGDHQSVLRIPYFSDEEVPYRYPSYAHGVPDARAGDSSLRQLFTGLGVTGIGLAVVAPAGRRRRGQRTIIPSLLLCAFVSSAMGACFGERPSSDAWKASEGMEPTAVAPAYQRGNLSKTGLGSLIGQIQARDVPEPIQGAFVALLRTSNHTKTDSYGRFVFKDLAAGTYHVRVDRQGFESFEGAVKVVAELIARVNITLTPTGIADAGQRPHLHDYWGGKTERILMKDADLGFTCPELPSTRCQPIMAFRIPLPTSDSEYASILPGTYEVNVTFEWDPLSMYDGKYTTAGLGFQANNDPSLVNVTPMLPRGPGQSFHIVAGWEMQDSGHQRFSTWTFQIHPYSEEEKETLQGNIVRSLETLSNEWFSDASFQVTVSIRKGVVPLEPAHHDFWRGQQSVDVLRDQRVFSYEAPRSGGYDWKPFMVANWWNVAWLPESLVPPGTLWIEVVINATRDQPIRYDLEFRYKTATSGVPSLGCWTHTAVHAYLGEFCDGPEYRTLGLVLPSTRSARLAIPLEPDASDPFYAARSFWVFGLQPKKDEATAVAMDLNTATLRGSPEFSLSVIAHRDPFSG